MHDFSPTEATFTTKSRLWKRQNECGKIRSYLSQDNKRGVLNDVIFRLEFVHRAGSSLRAKAKAR